MKKILYRSGYKYQLAEEYSASVVICPEEKIETDFIALEPSGLLTVKAGYAWDGPSGPTIDTKTFMRGALVHDALYQLMRNGHLPSTCREDADQELHRLCREDGMCAASARGMCCSVSAKVPASPRRRRRRRKSSPLRRGGVCPKIGKKLFSEARFLCRLP